MRSNTNTLFARFWLFLLFQIINSHFSSLLEFSSNHFSLPRLTALGPQLTCQSWAVKTKVGKDSVVRSFERSSVLSVIITQVQLKSDPGTIHDQDACNKKRLNTGHLQGKDERISIFVQAITNNSFTTSYWMLQYCAQFALFCMAILGHITEQFLIHPQR